jgi:hypothetical protein
MPANVRTAVIENIAAVEKSLSAKSMEVARLKEELALYQNILALLSKQDRAQNGGRSERIDVKALLRAMPANFSSKDFLSAASSAGASPLYLRQMLTRWTKQGKLKRVQRGRYHKTKKASSDQLSA